MLELKQIARALEGEVSGGQVLCPGPGHSAKDRSLAVRLNRDGGITVHSFSGDPWRQCRDYVKRRLGLPGPEMASARPNVRRESSPLCGLTMRPARPA